MSGGSGGDDLWFMAFIAVLVGCMFVAGTVFVVVAAYIVGGVTGVLVVISVVSAFALATAEVRKRL
jgi:hypothetical protein